jgi:chemotaxis protein MotB
MAFRKLRQDDLENELNKGALWAVTYGDLMSYLMILFLILFTGGLSKSKTGGSKEENFAKSLVSIQKIFGGKGSSPELERLGRRDKEESMVTQLRESLDKSELSQFAKIESWDKKVRLVLASAVTFPPASATLSPQGRKMLALLAEQLRPLPNPITVEGHTDIQPVRGGRFGSNLELSMARAYAVITCLVENGIPASRLAGIGYGDQHPVSDNTTPEGRAKNRRIEINLIRED